MYTEDKREKILLLFLVANLAEWLRTQHCGCFQNSEQSSESSSRLNGNMPSDSIRLANVLLVCKRKFEQYLADRHWRYLHEMSPYTQ